MIFSQKGLKCSINWSYRGFLLFSLVIFISCNSEPKVVTLAPINEIYQGTFDLHLDERTSQESFFLQAVGEDTVILLNRAEGNLVLFDAQGQVISKYYYASDGPNRVNVNGFQYCHPDTIVTTDFYQNISLVDTAGKLKGKWKSFDLDKFELEVDPSPTSTNSSPFFKRGDKVYFNNAIFSDKIYSLFAELDLRDGTINYLDIKFPEIYQSGFWVSNSFQFVSSTYLPKEDELIVNFPNLSSLYRYRFADGSLTEIPLAHSQLINEITALFPDKESARNASPEALAKRELSKDFYHSLYLDRENEVYYRLVGIGKPESVYDAQSPEEQPLREYALMVYDQEFQLQGEYTIDAGVYNMLKVFISPKGLHLMRLDSEEDKMSFDVFSFK
ncbi:DUF4221 family protein [Penaeicola halotolerans]|uniref:DUF4221 family protein n=1 Tax=Penaeicola halotolerans TaxID=2793196 RepID=UPI001CF8BC9C|nr:DUF4221 family protein [Penaeicola halotolerans]